MTRRKSSVVPAVFLSKLDQAQRLLSQRGIPFRLLGSVATYSYVQGLTERELSFSRSTLLPRHQQIPDLDFLVPQEYLQLAEEVRTEMLSDHHYPVNLELLSGLCHFDWRPAEEQSYIVHRDLRIACPTTVFDARSTQLEGSEVVTVDVRTLLHTYMTMGATLRSKDREFVRQLARLQPGTSCSTDLRPFHRFILDRQRKYRFYVFTRVIGEKLRCNLPTPIYYWIVNGGKRLQPLVFGAKRA